MNVSEAMDYDDLNFMAIQSIQDDNGENLKLLVTKLQKTKTFSAPLEEFLLLAAESGALDCVKVLHSLGKREICLWLTCRFATISCIFHHFR